MTTNQSESIEVSEKAKERCPFCGHRVRVSDGQILHPWEMGK